MKTTKSILAVFLAVLMLCGTFSLTVSAEAPKITDIKWNDDFSLDFNFDGATKYVTSIYINGYMIWGFGTVTGNKITREKMLPYMTGLARDAISREHYTGDVSFDFVIYAKNDRNETISSQTKVSKTLNIEDVAAGKLSPGTEKWQYSSISTTDKEKLSTAMYAAYDPSKSAVEATLAGTGLTYDQYIAAVVNAAASEAHYVFKGTLNQTMNFGSVYNSYCYTDVRLVQTETKISVINLSINQPAHRRTVAEYSAGENLKCDTVGVTVTTDFDAAGAYEVNTRTLQSKFYCGNSYDIPFIISFEKGYVPADNLTVTVNGMPVNCIDSSTGTFNEIGGYRCIHTLPATGNFLQKISTLFHNIITKIKYPTGI